MELNHELAQEALILKPAGRLDSNTAQAFEKALLEQLQAHPRVVLDLSGLDYVSSAGLRVLLIAAKQVKQSAGKLALCALQPAIHQVFEMSGFLTILTVCDARDEALARVKG